MRRILLIAAAALPLSGLLGLEEKKPAPPPPERVGVEVDDPKLKADIEDCIRRGVAWLKEHQEPSGAWPSMEPGKLYPGNSGEPYLYKYELTALALLALLKCDVPPKDPCIVQGIDWLKKNGTGIIGSYGNAITLLLLEARYVSKESVAAKDGKKKPAKPKPERFDPEDTLWAAKLVAGTVSCQHSCGGWRYGGMSVPLDMEGGKPGVADVSATQYALLGLHAARRMGIPVNPDVFYRASDFLMAQQDPDGKRVSRITERARVEADNPRPEGTEEAGDYGKDRIRGWAYMRGDGVPDNARSSAGMTCAGIVGIMTCRNACMDDKALKKVDKDKRLAGMEQSIYDGLAWLDAHWSTGENIPQEDRELGYYLYALERVGIMTDLRFIGPGHDWYLEGARVWTRRITEEGEMGYWDISTARKKVESQDTPFALLFLRKAVLVSYPIGEAE